MTDLETLDSTADVGIAIGSGTDVAIEAADVSDNIGGLVTAIRLSRATLRNIRQNLVLAIVYNAIGIPIAAGLLYPFTGWLLSPMIAAAAMAASSLSVIGNANRLRRWHTTPLPGPDMQTHDHEHHDHEAAGVIDPVCDMTVDPARAATTADHDGTTSQTQGAHP